MSPHDSEPTASNAAALSGQATPTVTLFGDLRGGRHFVWVVVILAIWAIRALPGAALSGPPAETPATPLRRLYDADLRPLTLTSDQIVDFLARAEVMETEALDQSTRTHPDKLLLERDGLRLHAIFHSFDQAERHVLLGDLRVDGFLDSYRNQVAAYELSRLLGMDNVPPATLRTLAATPGAVSLWLEDSLTWTNWQANHNPMPGGSTTSLPVEGIWERQGDDMRVFDALINNLDRHGSNIMIDAQQKLWLIDHTRTFVRDPQLSATALDIERCSTRMWTQLQQLDRSSLRHALSPYLGRDELKGLQQRRRRLIKLLRKAISERGAESVLFDLVVAPPASR